MQEDNFGNIWVGSLISCCIPNCNVMPSILVGFFWAITSNLNSKLSANVPNLSRDWFSDLTGGMKLHILSPNFKRSWKENEDRIFWKVDIF